MDEANTLEAIVEKGFLVRIGRRVKHASDIVLLAAPAVTAATYLTANQFNEPLEQMLEGNPNAILTAYTNGAYVLLSLASSYLIGKYLLKIPQVRRFAADLWKEKWKKIKSAIEPSAISYASAFALISLLTLPIDESKFNNSFKNPFNLFNAINSVRRLSINIEDLGKIQRFYRDGEFKEYAQGFNDRVMQESIDAQVGRKLENPEARAQLGRALYRLPKYEGFIKAAYEKYMLTEKGLSYNLFLAALVNESSLDPNAVSPQCAVGIGQQLADYARKLGFAVHTTGFENKPGDACQKAFLAEFKRNPNGLRKNDARLNPKLSIEMMAMGLAISRNKYPHEAPEFAFVRYHSGEEGVRRAQKLVGYGAPKTNVPVWRVIMRLGPNGSRYIANVAATDRIIQNYSEFGIVPIPVKD